jgi:predicted Zn-dependent protease
MTTIQRLLIACSGAIPLAFVASAVMAISGVSPVSEPQGTVPEFDSLSLSQVETQPTGEADPTVTLPFPSPSPLTDEEVETTDEEIPAAESKPEREEADSTVTPTFPSPSPLPDEEVETTDEEIPAAESKPEIEETEPTPDPETATEADPTDPTTARQQLLIEGDRLWQQGRYAEAEQLYRKAKGSFTGIEFSDRSEPITDPAQLPPGGQVYWREAQAGQAANLLTRVMVPLELLSEQHPAFIPGHLRYAAVLMEQDRPEAALDVLERAATLYPDQPDLIKARVDALAANEQWLEASIAARQYATLHPDSPRATEFQTLAADYLDTFQDSMQRRLTRNAIANAFTGALGYALTGGLFGPFSAIETTALLLRGEEAVGETIADRATEELEILDDPALNNYINELGQRLAQIAGRDEFEYEFYIVRDPELNAFALPGGKIFINAGAITLTNSEAELAGLIAHELSHTVLSHGFQLVTGSNVAANLFQVVPFGGYAANLAILSYSRDMERQADELGTRLLAASGYAADGLRNLMMTLAEQETGEFAIDWLSSHPDTDERIDRIDAQIERNGYNRYAYEGVARHERMQRRVDRLVPKDDEAEPDTPGKPNEGEGQPVP